ncbi:MAG: hypothetical protein EOO14_06660 [Chitinophagaceae bacterium]|nr:MAG: hypothetical protein EOO14_06660 [Chitinophagaceae bacterium]
MTYQEFNLLSYSEKIEATKKASHVMSLQDEQYFRFLYQLNGFYIEVFYHKELNFISALQGFIDGNLLTPYLDKIDLEMAY